MGDLTVEHTETRVVCTRCNTDYSNDRLELLIINDGDVCQSCEAELSSKYADGKSLMIESEDNQ